MSWQDIVFSVGTVIFSVSLIFSIRSENKPHLLTSFMTGSVMIVFVFTYFTLGLLFATVTALINAMMWYTLAWQKYNQQ